MKKSIITAIGILTLVPMVALADPSTNLMGYWSMDTRDYLGSGTVFDRSGSGFTGIIFGSPVKVNGKIGQALTFNATNNYISLGSVSRSIITGKTTFSVTFWAKGTSTAREAVFGCYNGAGSDYWSIDFNRGSAVPQTNFIRPVYRDATGNELSAYTTNAVTGVSDGKWHNYVITWTTTGNAIQIFYDGTPLALTADVSGSPAAAPTFSNGVWIGELDNVGSDTSIGYNGTMDDFRIYARALTRADAMQIYNWGLSAHSD